MSQKNATAAIAQKIATETTATWQRTLRDGTQVEVSQATVELRDRSGGLLVRFHDGHAEIHAPNGDLSLMAPRGSLKLEAAEDIALESGASIQLAALESFRAQVPAAGSIELEGSKARVEARNLEIEASTTSLRSERLQIMAKRFHGWVDEACTQAQRYELRADQLIHQANDLKQQVKQVLHTRAKRLDTKVEDSIKFESKRSILRSVYETTIEAKRVLLG